MPESGPAQVIDVCGVRLEYSWIEQNPHSPTAIVLLHEGLGSVAMWKTFPRRVHDATGLPVLAYSRAGHGKSSAPKEPRTSRYMHDEALVVLPSVLEVLGIRRPVLFGHSDGASIALIYASAFSRSTASLIALAPHVFVEDVTVRSVAEAKQDYESGSLRGRLHRYHDDVDCAFHGWSDIWLRSDFHSWSIEHLLPQVTCPVLAIQGGQDRYGTFAHLDRLVDSIPNIQFLRLDACGHSPHWDAPRKVLTATSDFLSHQMKLSLPKQPKGIP